MVGLDDENIDFPDVFAHMRGRMAKVGEPSEAAPGRKQVAVAMGDQEANGILRIVGHGKSSDLKITEAKRRARFEELPIDAVLEAALERLGRGPVGKYLDVRMAGEAGEGSGMITVFMCQENRIDPFERIAGFRQEFA